VNDAKAVREKRGGSSGPFSSRAAFATEKLGRVRYSSLLPATRSGKKAMGALKRLQNRQRSPDD
jgi:hypothetical protein